MDTETHPPVPGPHNMKYLADLITTQAQTIERLADALEFALAQSDASGLDDSEWQRYATKRWQTWSMLDIQKAESAARALLAKIRGAK
mgnify:CR=1 FL=1